MGTIRLAIAAVAALALTGCLEQQADHVAVVGVGEARLSPDRATMAVTVEGKGATAGAATEVVNGKVAGLLKIAEGFGSVGDDISSGYFNVDREQIQERLPDGGWRYVDGDFVATQTITVRTSKINEAGDLFGALIAAEAEGVSNPVYIIEDSAALFEKARGLAMKDARRRAELYAAEAGRTLGEATIVEEAGTDAQRLEFNLRDRFVARYAQDEQGGELLERAAAPMSDKIVVTASRVFTKPEEIAVTVSIYAKFDLE